MPVVKTANAKLALVEDDAALRNALAFALRLDGYDVVPFADAESFLKDPVALQCDFLIADLKLPGMDGLDLIRELRALGGNPPMLLITTSTAAIKKRASASNVPILDKPFVHSSLSLRIQELMTAA